MANRCDICNKGRLVGNKVSHSNIKSKTVQRPNLQARPRQDQRQHAAPARLHPLPPFRLRRKAL